MSMTYCPALHKSGLYGKGAEKCPVCRFTTSHVGHVKMWKKVNNPVYLVKHAGYSILERWMERIPKKTCKTLEIAPFWRRATLCISTADMEYLKSKRIHMLERSSQSLGLFPIGHLWLDIKISVLRQFLHNSVLRAE